MSRPELVEVTLDRNGSTAWFCVTPGQPIVGDVLAAMGFRPQKGYFVRSFPDSDDVPRIFANFNAHIDEMIRCKTRATPTPWEHALEVVAERLTGRVEWWLSGSAALGVRGIDTRARDIDLIVDDAERTGDLLNDILVEPVTPMRGWVADWFGRAFDGALIEWVSHVHPDIDKGGPQEQGPTAASQRELVAWRGHEILCSPLGLQLSVCEARGLIAEAEAIRLFIGQQH